MINYILVTFSWLCTITISGLKFVFYDNKITKFQERSNIIGGSRNRVHQCTHKFFSFLQELGTTITSTTKRRRTDTNSPPDSWSQTAQITISNVGKWTKREGAKKLEGCTWEISSTKRTINFDDCQMVSFFQFFHP